MLWYWKWWAVVSVRQSLKIDAGALFFFDSLDVPCGMFHLQDKFSVMDFPQLTLLKEITEFSKNFQLF